MTLDELRDACRKARANLADIGMDPDDAHLVLVIPGHRKRERARVMPGVTGRVVGIDNDRTTGKPITVVDVMVSDVMKAITCDGAVTP